MEYLFELSGEHPTLPAAEALAVLRTAGNAEPLVREEGVLIAAGPEDARALLPRLALSHTASGHAFTCSPLPEAVLASLPAVAPSLGASFAVRCHRLGKHGRGISIHALERDAGARLAGSGRRVSLEEPETEIRVLLSERAHAGVVIHRVDRSSFEARHLPKRAFFRPVGMHPRLARALVNLARLKPGQTLLDPFCGTGGIAIEAGMTGLRVIASDADPEMVDGTAKVLGSFGLSADVAARDVGEVARLEVDAVATDPPYGRSASRRGESRDALYARALESFRACIRPGGRLVIAFPEARHAALARERFSVEELHEVRVHRSLTRHVVVARRV